MNNFKIEKKQVTRFSLHLECCECSLQDEIVIGYDFLTRGQALRQVPDEIGGWNLSNREKPLCPECRTKSGKSSRF